jgi:hypothetical protein
MEDHRKSKPLIVEGQDHRRRARSAVGARHKVPNPRLALVFLRATPASKLAVCQRPCNWRQEIALHRLQASVGLLRPAAPFLLCAWQSLRALASANFSAGALRAFSVVPCKAISIPSPRRRHRRTADGEAIELPCGRTPVKRLCQSAACKPRHVSSAFPERLGGPP